MNSKKLVYDTLNFKSPERAPRQLWCLDYARIYHSEELSKILTDYPEDIIQIQARLKTPLAKVSGVQTQKGVYTDEWGSVFINISEGYNGEVKEPLILDDEWRDADKVHIPEELLSFDIDEVNGRIATEYADKFILSGCCPRPFEQLQFIRGTENLYIDLMMRPKGMFEFMEKMHDFYMRLLEKWCLTDIDAIYFMDDWGSQNSLLISPELFNELFMPMYKDYIALAKEYNKKTFMHTDGNTLAIIPKLIDAGLDALNSQLFCIGLDNLKDFRGNITFWGEIDRQHLLPYGSVSDIKEAVRQIYGALWANGGCIAQCEFGPGARPENVRAVYSGWDEVTMKS
jgi:uroporphyrinogen decarboxylase